LFVLRVGPTEDRLRYDLSESNPRAEEHRLETLRLETLSIGNRTRKVHPSALQAARLEVGPSRSRVPGPPWLRDPSLPNSGGISGHGAEMRIDPRVQTREDDLSEVRPPLGN
jgi:hypothetical protein